MLSLDPLMLTALLGNLLAIAGVWAHLLSRLSRVEARLDWLHDELRRLRDVRNSDRASHPR